ncbi:PH domain-containing protein [Streptomyces sp. HNM0574]|uniref:PH domain-containing protein n=1 Tax=Streptomyces sp. HNM0574 TaxID=2714954 RepID=UPI00146DFAE6|nr:PH domain-containing protein [Streptomyces sp. HNM0574]NLU68501.1 PH domain-containing protein [Streptomyces sp. HNM0574]
MAIAERYLADDEQLVHVTRQHWTEMVSEFVVLCLIWVAAAVLVWIVPSGEDWSATAFYIIVGLGLLASLKYWLVPLLKWRSKLYILTTKRIYKRSGFLTKTSRSIPLARVNDVGFKATLWERIMRYGTLTIQSASEHGMMTLRHVPQPEHFKAEIYRAVDEEQHQL